MAVEFYAYEDLGFIVDPESDTKEVFIPSPPTTTTMKINPRPVIIYLTGGKVKEGYEKLEALKAYAEENKVVFVCPSSNDGEVVGDTYQYIQKNAKKINVKKNELCVQCLPECADEAQEAVDYLVDELDADVEEAEEFEV